MGLDQLGLVQQPAEVDHTVEAQRVAVVAVTVDLQMTTAQLMVG